MKSQAGRIVVGYDGSPHSNVALEWAAAEAERRGRPLTVLHVLDYLGMIPSPMSPFGWLDEHDENVVRIAQEGAEAACKLAPSVEVTPVTVVARVSSTLIEYSATAELLVVGTRGHGDLAGTVLGSVAFAMSAHAPCPVVVVRGQIEHPAAGHPVVLGVDGSPGSDEAVRYAADVAASHRAPLTIVSAYRALASQAWAEAAYVDLEHRGGPDFDTVARESARTAVTAAKQIARQGYPGLEITEQVLEGQPAEVLTSTAKGAGLLVVGSRGHGGFTGLLLGSVGHALIHSAPCPVAIVHGAKGTATSSGGFTN